MEASPPAPQGEQNAELTWEDEEELKQGTGRGGGWTALKQQVAANEHWAGCPETLRAAAEPQAFNLGRRHFLRISNISLPDGSRSNTGRSQVEIKYFF